MWPTVAVGLVALVGGLVSPPTPADPVAPMGGVSQFSVVVADDVTIDRGALREPAGWAAGPTAVGGRVVAQGDPAATPSTVDNSVIDFATLFGELRLRSSRLAQCASTLAIQDGHLDLTSGRTNVLNLTGAQFNALGAIVFDSPPTAGSPLLINVDTWATGGTFTWHGPQLVGIDSEQTAHILFHFPSAVELHHAAGAVQGTIYAPYAHLVDADPAAVEGALVVRSLQTGTRQKKANPFGDTLTCEPPAPAPVVADTDSDAALPPPEHRDQAVTGSLSTSPVAWIGLGLSLLGLMVLLALLGTRRRYPGSHK